MKIYFDKLVKFLYKYKVSNEVMITLVVILLSIAAVFYVFQKKMKKSREEKIKFGKKIKDCDNIQTTEEMFKSLEQNGFVQLKAYRPNQEEDVLKYEDELFSVKQFKKTYPKAKGFLCYTDHNQSIPYVGICDPNVIHEFMVDKEKYYERDITVSYVARILGDSLLFNLQDQWRMKRKIYGQMFHFYQYHSLVKLVNQITINNLNMIDEYASEPIQILPYLEDILGEWALHLFFGNNTHNQDLQSQLKNAYNNARSAILLLQPQNINNCLQPFKDILLENLFLTSDQIKSDPNYLQNPQNNITWYLLNSSDIVWNKQFLDQICQDITIFFFAGRDTMAHTLQMMFYYLCIYPQYKQKIDEEIKNLNGDYSIQNISQMNYLEAVFKETLRFYGPTTTILPKVAMERHFLVDGKVYIEEGTIVSLAILELNYDPQYYQNPDVFYPERWFDDSLKQKEKNIFMPFSYGSHKCIGDKLALPVMKMLFITFSEYFSFELDPSFHLKLVALIQYTPSKQIPLILRKKKNISISQQLYISK